MGKILNVDLSKRSIKVESTDEKIAKKYIGGKGYALYLLYQILKEKKDKNGAIVLHKKVVVAIVGSRTITDCEHIIVEAIKGIRVGMIISGEAEGVDATAKEYAEKNKIAYKPFPPDLKRYPYKTYGNYTYFKRNTEIVDFADIIIVIWDGRSGGTADVIQKAKEKKKKLIIKRI